MEYPLPAIPRAPHNKSQILSQYTPSMDTYSQDFNDPKVNESNPLQDTTSTSSTNAISQLDQGHSTVFEPQSNMPSFRINAQGTETLLIDSDQQVNNGHSVHLGSLPDTISIAPRTDNQITQVANVGQQATGAGYMFPRNTDQRSNPGNDSLPRFLPSTSLPLDYGHDARYDNTPTTPSAEFGTHDSYISITNTSPQSNHVYDASHNASPDPSQQHNHGYRAIQERSPNASQQSNYVVHTDHPIAINRSNTTYNAPHSTPPNTGGRFYHEHNPLHNSALNTPTSGLHTRGNYENGGYLLYNAPGSEIPIDPALTAIPIPIDEPPPHQTHPGFVSVMLQAASNPRSRPQRAPLVIGGGVFSMAEQRVIIIGRHLLGYTAEHIAPVFGLQDDGSGEPAKSAKVIEAAYQFLKDGQKYQASTGLWAESDDMISARLDVKIRAARQKQIRVQVERIKCEEAISLNETRHNMASMDDEMEAERIFCICQSRTIQSFHVLDG